MKEALLKDGSTVYCISTLEAQMLELHIAEYFKNGININDGDTVIDVGANIGIFGHQLSKQFKDIEIIALEPVPSIFEVLQHNVKLTKNNKYKILPYGLSNINEFKNIIYYPNSPALSTSNPEIWDNNNQLLLAFKGSVQSGQKIWWWSKFIPSLFFPFIISWLKKDSINIKCELNTLSYVIEKNSLKKIDLLKIDCEGNELKVLEGIAIKDWEIIKQIVLEVHNIDGRYNQIVSILKNHGFKLETFKESSLKETNIFNIYAIK